MREDNRKYYEDDEVQEETIEIEEKDKDNRYAQMAEQIELSQKQQEFNSILYMHKINSLKIPKVLKRPDPVVGKLPDDKLMLAKRASGFSSKWMYNRSLHEIRSCIRTSAKTK